MKHLPPAGEHQAMPHREWTRMRVLTPEGTVEALPPDRGDTLPTLPLLGFLKGSKLVHVSAPRLCHAESPGPGACVKALQASRRSCKSQGSRREGRGHPELGNSPCGSCLSHSPCQGRKG